MGRDLGDLDGTGRMGEIEWGNEWEGPRKGGGVRRKTKRVILGRWVAGVFRSGWWCGKEEGWRRAGIEEGVIIDVEDLISTVWSE